MVKGGEPYFLTAGHCTEAISSWSDSQGGAEIGTNAGSSFPDNDYGLVKYTSDTAHPSEVDLYNGSAQPITKAGEATVGMTVTRSGSTTQVHDGEVTGLDATVNYGNGDIVNGLIQTTVCAEPGDSGGSLFMRRHGDRPDLGRQRRLLLGRRDVLPAGAGGAVGVRGGDRLTVLPCGGGVLSRTCRVATGRSAFLT